MQVTLSKSLLTKIIIAAVLLVAGSGVFVYELTLHQVDQKYKAQQSSGGSIPISTSGLSKDFVSLNGGNPQSGNINLNGDISGNNVQGQTITSSVQDGTSPLNVNSSTLVKNLNADMVDGKHADELSKPTVNNITNTTTGETIQPGTNADYYRGDKSWQTLDKSAVGLSSVENTALSTWTGSGDVAILGTVTSGTWNAGSINAAGSITCAALQGTSLNLGSGTIASGTINGQTISSSANFTGTITAAGTINGATISGGALSGGNVSGGTVQGGTLSSTAVNGVTTANILVNTGSYTDPSWLSSLAGSKITGDISGNAAGLAGTPNITVGTISSGNITSSGTLDITGTGNSVVGGNISVNPDYGSELVTNGNFNGNANNWLVSCTSSTCTTPDTPNSVPASGWSYGSNSVSHASGTNNTDALYQDISNTTGETYGPNLVKDGNFTVDPSTNGWSLSAGWSWSGGKIVHGPGSTHADAVSQDLSQNGTITPGALYKVQLTTSGMGAGTSLNLSLGTNQNPVDNPIITGNGTHVVYVTDGALYPDYLFISASSLSAVMSLDDISVAQVTGAAQGELFSQSYRLNFTVSGMTGGSFVPKLGEAAASPIVANGTYTQYLNAKPNANIVSFVPTNDATFTIANISATKVQNGTITAQDIITKGGPKVDVRAFGAKGDGVTDDTAAIQAAEDSLPDQGGILYFPPGTFLGHVVVKSNIHIEGSGTNSTILKLPNGANTDVIQSKDFASLTGTSDFTNANGITLENITLDGNSSNNLSGYGIRKDGGFWTVRSVDVQDCASGGVYSELRLQPSNTVPGTYSGNETWDSVNIDNNEGVAVTWNGPGDTEWDNTMIFENAGDGIDLNAGSGIFQLSQSHLWQNHGANTMSLLGQSMDVSNTQVEGSILVGAGGSINAVNDQIINGATGITVNTGGSPAYNAAKITGCTFSSISGTDLYLTGSANTVTGNVFNGGATNVDIHSGQNNVISNNQYLLATTAISVGNSSNTANNNVISGRFGGNTTAIQWGNSGNTGNDISGVIVTTSGQTAISGTPSASNKINVLSTGTGTNYSLANLPNQLQVESTQTSGNVVTIAAPVGVALTGNLVGQRIDLGTNYTANGQSSTGQWITTPSATNTGSGTEYYNGIYINGSSIVQNTSAGTDIWTGVGISKPNITQATGSVTSVGVEIYAGTVTSGNNYGIIVDPNAGNVGIGTTAPASLFTVNAPITNDASTVTAMITSAADANKGLVIQRHSATQSASLLEIQGSTGAANILFKVDASGNLTAQSATFTGTLTVNGSITTAFAAKSASYTVTSTDSVLTGNATTSPVTFTLPTASGIAGREYTFKKIDSSANAVTIATSSSQTIDGLATYSLASQWKYVRVISDGSNWIVVGNN